MQPRDYPQGHPQQGHPQQGYPQQGYPQQGNPQPQQSQQQYQAQPQQIVVQTSSGGMKPLLIVGGVIVGIAILVVLAGVLYVWANSLVEDELEGTWYDEENAWIEFSSDNTLDCRDCPFEGWSLGESSGEVGFCDDSPSAQGGGCDGSYYYVYEYEVKGDVLFLAPHDSRGIIESAKCNIFVKSGNSYYSTANSETSPYWCDA